MEENLGPHSSVRKLQCPTAIGSQAARQGPEQESPQCRKRWRRTIQCPWRLVPRPGPPASSDPTPPRGRVTTEHWKVSQNTGSHHLAKEHKFSRPPGHTVGQGPHGNTQEVLLGLPWFPHMSSLLRPQVKRGLFIVVTSVESHLSLLRNGTRGPSRQEPALTQAPSRLVGSWCSWSLPAQPWGLGPV